MPLKGRLPEAQGRATTRSVEEADVKVYLARRNRIIAKLHSLGDGNFKGRTSAPLDDRTQYVTPRREHVDPLDVDAGRLRAMDAAAGQTRTTRHAESAAPPGVRFALDGPPPKSAGLLAHYLWRFKREVRTLDYGHMLCTEAERDYQRESAAPEEIKIEKPAETDARVLRTYKGRSPAYVAVWENCEQEYVIRLRHREGLDPETGLENGEEIDGQTGNGSNRSATTPIATAESLLVSMLSARPQRATVMFERARACGVSEKTLKRAKANLGVESFKRADGWAWRMAGSASGPPRGPLIASTGPTPENVQASTNATETRTTTSS